MGQPWLSSKKNCQIKVFSRLENTVLRLVSGNSVQSRSFIHFKFISYNLVTICKQTNKKCELIQNTQLIYRNNIHNE